MPLVLTTKKRDLGPLLPVVCPRCGSDTFYRLLKARRWLTLLWVVPLLPLHRADYYLYCAACDEIHDADEIGKSELSDMRQITAKWLDYEISDETYATALEDRMGEYYADTDHLYQSVEEGDADRDDEDGMRGIH